jgi:hypothetical protein
MKKEITTRNPSKRIRMTTFFKAIFFSFACAAAAFAQTTAFTYQGKLNDGGAPANSSYDMRFRLFDAPGGTNQIGATVTVSNVSTVAGIFTVQLDFGASAFDGGERFVEIGISPAGQNNFVTLAPRQRLTSAPYAVKSVNATTAETSVDSQNLGGIAASAYVQTTDARLTDARVPLAGSSDYVQNNQNAPQASVSFNIGGSGSANILNAQTQFNLGGQRFISAAANGNLFVGNGTGANVTTGERNTFVGLNAGAANTFGSSNSFFGDGAGSQSLGHLNSFFGVDAGRNNAGTQNSFFGGFAGYANGDGNFNAFFGYGSGFNNTAGSENSFFGNSTGITNTTGNANSFFGFEAGRQNGVGNGNSFFGSRAGGDNFSGLSNTFIGSFAGRLNQTGSTNSFVGASAGFNNTSGESNVFVGASAGIINATGSRNTIIGATANLGANNLTNATAIGFGAQVTQNNSLILGGPGTNGFPVNVGIGTTAPSASLHINRVEEGIRLQGRAVNNNNLAYMSFVDSAGNQMGYVGDGGFNDRGIFLAATGDDVALITPAGRVLTASFAGNVLMRGGPTVLGSTTDFYAAQTIDTGNFKGLFTPNLFLSSLDTFLPSAVHVCARVQAIGGTGGLALTRCSTAFSSVANKTGVEPFSGGLNILRQLNPVSFRWKAGGGVEVGLNAEEVAEIAPALVTRNEKGEVEDVKENSLSVLFINAIKEQQKQIEAQAEQIKRQQSQIDALKKIACRSTPQADICREER